MKKNSVIITGEKELMVKLSQIEKELKEKITHDALLEGGKVIQQAASSNAPGSIAESIEIKIENDGNGNFYVLVGPDEEHWYANIIEHGAKKHKIKIHDKKVLTDDKFVFGKEVDHPGFKKKPFLRPALDNNETEAQRKMEEVIARALGVK